MRPDYLTRYDDLFLPPAFDDSDGRKRLGGFKYLETSGAWHVDAQHSHYPLFTGPGHAALLTGAYPYKSGIVGNYWYDRASATNRYCVEDPDGMIVGNDTKTKLPGVSPRSLQVTTVGDELKIATAGKAKVWGIGLKDRAAILMAGHLADGALWFDEDTGNWVTSSYYATNGVLRPWLKDLNDSRLVDRLTTGMASGTSKEPKRWAEFGRGPMRLLIRLPALTTNPSLFRPRETNLSWLLLSV